MTLVEAAIDFALEEHVYTISPAEIVEHIGPIEAGVAALLASYDAGRLQAEGVRVAIIGPPNAGKSTLLNHLLREDRAIVTPIAGTTRDTLEESLEVDGLRFILVDTAGLRETSAVVEALGVERSLGAVARADAVLVLGDPTAWQEVAGAAARAGNKPWSLVWNKSDLAEAPRAWTWAGPPPVATVSLSLATGTGTEVLGPLLIALARAAGVDRASESAVLTRARHRDVLTSCAESLERARMAAEGELGHELVALDLRAALDSLGELVGAVTTDDVLNRIFGDFCVGK